MKRWILLAAFLGVAVAGRCETNAYNSEKVTVTTSTAVGFTASKLVARVAGGANGGGTRLAFCTTETDTVRFEVDGSSPTATVGHSVSSGSSFTISGYDNVRAARFIGTGSASAVLQCTFEMGILP